MNIFKNIPLITAAVIMAAMPMMAKASTISLKHIPDPPPSLLDLKGIPDSKTFKPQEVDSEIEDIGDGMVDVRKNAIKEAALSYGARGGLAFGTYHVRVELEKRSAYMSKVYDFRRLLIPAPSGLLIEPPIVSESEDILDIDISGQEAAVVDRMYNINLNARIVTAPRTWRQYLERTWDDVALPPDLLRPADDEERAVFEEYVEKGWAEGLDQADEIFNQDLNQLVADFDGMVRYRKLLAQGMISKPYALQVDRGVTGGGDIMRVGDRAVQITGNSQLVTGYQQWKPASR